MSNIINLLTREFQSNCLANGLISSGDDTNEAILQEAGEFDQQTRQQGRWREGAGRLTSLPSARYGDK